MSMISEQVRTLRKMAKEWLGVNSVIYNELTKAADTIEVLSAKVRANNLYGGWIPTSERLPKVDEYVDDVCKYYLIQDEYGDMHIAHLRRTGWYPIESVRTIGCEVVAWMELPEKYGGEAHGE